ncbi:MAG: sugar kinase [Spirochaetaceae bacterium]|nr:MAG: sugar kinase [Spirochaetaceae bacterium]
MAATLTLGIDVSTQSISAAVLDPEARPVRKVADLSLPYRDDPRLNRFGIQHDSLLVPPRVGGEADQPPEMFLAGLDAILADLRAAGVDLGRVGAISVSAQQHGHVYLSEEGLRAIEGLQEKGGAAGATGPDLAARFSGAFAYGTAPIWQTADSQPQADEIRSFLGGTGRTVALSGSDSPARFSGAVMRRTARRYPEAWERTAQVALLSSFFSGLLAGNRACPIDWGNGSGMSLMDYRQRRWSPELLEAASQGLPGGAGAMKAKLPGLDTPVALAGRVARYFQDRYGFSPECLVNIGSGDNPQSKVMIDGDLLSLGTSFVYMVDTGKPLVDEQGYANSMYDGIGRAFIFACRTNGAMVWDRVRKSFGADLERAEAALSGAAAVAPGSVVEIWQPYAESYPVAPPVDNERARTGQGDFASIYAGIVDSALVLMRHYARGFERGHDAGPLALTGGPARSPGICARVAAIFERPVIVLESSGAALGAALSAWQTLCNEGGNGEGQAREAELSRIRAELVPPGEPVQPDPAAREAYRDASPRIVEALERGI